MNFYHFPFLKIRKSIFYVWRNINKHIPYYVNNFYCQQKSSSKSFGESFETQLLNFIKLFDVHEKNQKCKGASDISTFNALLKGHVFLEKSSVGLFGYKSIISPENIEAASVNALNIVQDFINNVNNEKKGLHIVNNFDDISNAICLIADLCSFLRCNHSDLNFSETCERIYCKISAFIERLNTDVKLYCILKETVASPEFSSFPDQARSTAEQLLLDFEDSSILGTSKQRAQFMSLTSLITDCVLNLERESQNFPSWFNRNFVYNKDKKTPIMSALETAEHLFLTSPDHSIRRMLYHSVYTVPTIKKKTLKTLFKARLELSRICGYESYGTPRT
jgi:intermediate peptidase